MTAFHAGVQQRLGLLPNFFRLAPENPEIAENIWAFAKFGYLDNPLPSLFKERLFVWLSRFCEVRYCIARHAGFLVGLGRIAGDANCRPQSVNDILRLLKRPVALGTEMRAHIKRCADLDELLLELPTPDSELESSVFACATHVFLHSPIEHDCLDALTHAFGTSRMEHLLVLLACVHTEHYWARVHPELAFEDDIRHLMATHQRLNRCLLDDRQARSGEIGQRLLDELDSLRREKQQAVRESDVRLQQELADSRLLHDISNELMGEKDGQELYGKLVDAASRLMHSQFASMQELQTNQNGQNGAGELLLLGHRGFIPEAARFWNRVRIDSGSSCGAALASGQRIVVSDVEQCEFMKGTEDLAMYLKTGIRAVQTTPLYSRSGALVGAISTHWHEPHQPSEHELQLFDILARQAADLIERTKVEEALHASEDRCRRALQPQNVGVVFFDTEGRITEANDAFLSMSGYSRADVAAGHLRWDEMTPPEWMETSLRAIEEFKEKGCTKPYEKEYIHKDGSRWCALVAETRLSENDGVKFVIDITDRKDAERALRDADRRKDEFLATLAHELRNPLAPITTALHILKRMHTGGRRCTDRMIGVIDRQVAHMAHLVEDLLEISRITTGKIELSKERINLIDVIHGAVESSMTHIETGKHRLILSLPEKPLWVNGDAVRLNQVFANLLNNAAKYTNENGQISVTAFPQERHAVVLVRDNGLGIPRELLTQVFDLFLQTPECRAKAKGGLGIGLSMVKQLVQMHGGTVEAKSEGINKGSEFIVRLPLLQYQNQEVRKDLVLDHASQLQLAGCSVLVVDDNQDAANTLATMLEMDGAEVHVAHNGMAALTELESYHPKAVVLDIGLPDICGYEVAQRIRELPDLQGIHLIALTGWGQESDRQKSSASGFNEHLTKPVDIDMLETLLMK